MIIGVPKEVKAFENRVAITPAGVQILVGRGHSVIIENDAGKQSGFTNEQYEQAGARIVPTAKEAWDVDMVLKVKEPIEQEYQYFREGLILFTYLHLAADHRLTEEMLNKKVVGIAYETVQLPGGALPLLTPMSEIAGRMAAQIGAQLLERTHGGKGIILSGVPGVKRGTVTVIGGGVVGYNAARIAAGLGADVTILDVNPARLRELDNLFGNTVSTLISNEYNIEKQVAESDLVIGAVLIPGAKAPKLVTEKMVEQMEENSVIVDVAIDQGGIFETSDRVTTHANPTYLKHGVVHYAVGNMPGAVPKTSSVALTNVTIPYALKIANNGFEKALIEDPVLAKGCNTLEGFVTYDKVAEAHQLPYKSFDEIVGCGRILK